MGKAKEPVRLRSRLMPSGRRSLYLDVYVGGRRHYEYLRLYLEAGSGRREKEKNAETMRLAEAVRAKRLVEVQNGRFGFAEEEDGGEISFFDYYESLARRHKGTSRQTRLSALAKLREYEHRDIKMSEITRSWVEGFVRHLENARASFTRKERGISGNTQHLYLEMLRMCFTAAVREGLLKKSPMDGVRIIPYTDPARGYLTREELRRLAETPCRREEVGRMFLFSCLTGLRWCDISALHWGDVAKEGEFVRITFRQKKTGGQEYLDITPQAVSLMGERRADSEKVFPRQATNPVVSKVIAAWMERAGIRKKITFHCARHTFAVMMLDIGTDIYTVSKLLGHRSLSTTQIYARVLDRAKQAAVLSIPDIIV